MTPTAVLDGILFSFLALSKSAFHRKHVRMVVYNIRVPLLSAKYDEYFNQGDDAHFERSIIIAKHIIPLHKKHRKLNQNVSRVFSQLNAISMNKHSISVPIKVINIQLLFLISTIVKPSL